ncbi:MAG: ankyrin repeat domain-containing protein [Bryobacteraceae bacterium]
MRTAIITLALGSAAFAAPATNETPRDSSTPLHWAVYRDDIDATRKLIAEGASVKTANRYGVTPLSLAALNGNRAMVDLLLDAGADPNTALPGGETVLMTAARTGRLDAVKTLIAHGADVKAKEEQRGQTAVMWAAAEGHASVAAELIEHGADFRERLESGFNAFLLAVRSGHTEAVDTLLASGANVNEEIDNPNWQGRRPRLMKGPRAGTSALVLATLNGHFELAAHLLDKGADPNSDTSGWTALHAITGVRKPGGGDNDPAPYGSGEMTSLGLIRKLAAKGANLNARMTKKINVGLTSLNTLGATPFFLAARSADSEMMLLLAELGADPLLTNEDGSTPLIAAAGLGTRSPGEDAGTEDEAIAACKVALDLGNNIDAVDANGETAMHGAAYKNLPGVVEYLASRGADIKVWNRPNKRGWTPLVIAVGYRFGNFKPSPVTVAAFHKAMRAAGVEPPANVDAKGLSDYR